MGKDVSNGQNGIVGGDKTHKKPKLPKLEMRNDGVCSVIVDENKQVASIFGGSSPEFATALLNHCVSVSGTSKRLEQDKTHAIAIVAEIEPQDAIEALIATQMAAIHIATMRTSRLLAGAEILPQLEVQERALNKLARTFTAQMEALRKHRNGGKQVVQVQHVNVENGGQAIVGNVETGGRGNAKK